MNTVSAPPALPTTTDNLVLSSTEQRALDLLGQGIEPVIVASAVGVSEARISQLISDPYFSAKVYELRYKTLAKHAKRDNAYDALEEELQEKLKDCLPLMMRPMEILAAIRVINQAKRRSGQLNPSGQTQAPVIALTLPINIINQFRLDSNNQVIQAGQQALITVQSGNMKKLLDQHRGTEQNVELLPTNAASAVASANR